MNATPSFIQVLNLVDLTPSSKQVEVTDPDTFKTASYETDYGFIKVKATFGRDEDDVLTTVTYTVVA